MTNLRILDLDSECRPIAYMGPDFTSGDLTAIAAGFVGESKIHCWYLGKHTAREMLLGFRELYDEADIVTAHNLRKHDLPLINGAMIEAGLPPLSPKLTSDTYKDLARTSHISRAQENLAQMLGLTEEKTHMSNALWRKSNRLTRGGIARTRARVVGDVKQHMALRAKLIRLGLLGAPKTWQP